MHEYVFPQWLSCSFLLCKVEVSVCVCVLRSLSIWECRSLTITWSCPSVMSLRSVGFRLLFIKHSLMWGMCGSWRTKNKSPHTNMSDFVLLPSYYKNSTGGSERRLQADRLIVYFSLKVPFGTKMTSFLILPKKPRFLGAFDILKMWPVKSYRWLSLKSILQNQGNRSYCWFAK